MCNRLVARIPPREPKNSRALPISEGSSGAGPRRRARSSRARHEPANFASSRPAAAPVIQPAPTRTSGSLRVGLCPSDRHYWNHHGGS